MATAVLATAPESLPPPQPPEPPSRRVSRLAMTGGFGGARRAAPLETRSFAYDAAAKAVYMSCFAAAEVSLLKLDLLSGNLTTLPRHPFAQAPRICLTADGGGLLATTGRSHTIVIFLFSVGEWTLLAGLEGSRGFVDGMGKDARLNTPLGICAMRSGRELFVCDWLNHAIRSVSLSWSSEAATVSTWAGGSLARRGPADGVGPEGRLWYPTSLCLSLDETVLYVGEPAAVRVIALSSRVIRTLAGGAEEGLLDAPGGAARFNSISGMTVDRVGNLFCADQLNHCVRVVSPAGAVSTLAGTGARASIDGDFDKAAFNGPIGIVATRDGSLLVAESGAPTLRVLSCACEPPIRRYRFYNHLSWDPVPRAVITTLLMLARVPRETALSALTTRLPGYLLERLFDLVANSEF